MEGDFTLHRSLVASIGNAVTLDAFDRLHLRKLGAATRAVGLNPVRPGCRVKAFLPQERDANAAKCSDQNHYKRRSLPCDQQHKP